ncbi:MAG: hypothetical protein GX086_07575 [Alcaligenaceae bacterium]|nr:hypothetical protein [Alcaligenaceae bacterium]
MSLSNLLARAHPLVEARLQDTASTPHIFFFSLSDGQTRANVYRGAGASFRQAWQDGVALCQREAQRNNLAVRWLRIDWVTGIQPTTWGELAARLAVTKRNYFRLGLALDADLRLAFLEQELNANAMLYQGANTPAAGLNEKNFLSYAKRRFGQKVELDFSPQSPVHVFTHDGLFLVEDTGLAALPEGRAPVWLPGPGKTDLSWRDPAALNAGRRQIKKLNQKQVYALIDSSASFLARQVKKTGQFIYGHFPCFGREIPTYNSLRHASSVYSMLEAWELTRDGALLEAIRRALAYLTGTLIRRYPQPDGTALSYNVDVNGEIKLGANAVSLLALVKYDELTGDTQHRALMEELALGVARMQDSKTGGFVHVLNADDLTLKEAFRIVYYDGEAAFGLMRLYGLTADPRWIEIVEKAFDYFIAAEHWKHHDHWLSYCANELTLHKPEEKYFRFGVQNIAGYLDFILQRETTYPTLLELSMAFEAMLRRIESDFPDMRHVLDGLDIDKFYRALHHRAHYLLNGFFWPEQAMYFAKPAAVVGSFFIRHHTFRVRIDDIEHYLSGYVAYYKMLGRGGGGDQGKTPLFMQEAEMSVAGGAMMRTDIAVDRNSIGVLMYPLSPKGFREVEAYAAKAAQHGLTVVYLSYRNPGIESNRIAGYLYKHGRWLPGYYLQPAIIDNAPPRDVNERSWFELLGTHSFMTCNKLGGKDVTLPLLAADERCELYMIPSAGLSQVSLQQFLNRYGCAIIKPVRSNRGRNVFLLRRCDDGLHVNVITREGQSLLDEVALSDFVNSRSESAWLVQRYVPSIDSQGRAFDVRVALFRADKGEWRIARSYVRLGGNPVTSNLATGGSALDAGEFLATFYSLEQAKALTEQFEIAAQVIVEVLQENYPFLIDALGCDFGIADGEIYLFEVNSYPGIKGCLQAATDAKVAFHCSLLRVFQNSSRTSFRNNRVFKDLW